MMGVHVSLQPVLVSEYCDTFELIVVEIKASDRNIRVITGYGPQENVNLEIKMNFFSTLEEEVIKATNEGKSVIMMMDANSKLGPDYIKNDPHEQSENGKILAEIIERNALTVVNGMDQIASGLITRERHTLNGIEKSVIDFVIVTNDLVSDVESIMIDDKRNHVLTNHTKNSQTKSDHNIIVTNMNVKVNMKLNKTKHEFYNFKDKKCQIYFKDETSKTNELSRIFDSEKDINAQTKKFIKRLNGFISQCFKKIKITENKDENLENLYNKRTYLRNRVDIESINELKKVEKELNEKYSEKMYDKIKSEIDSLNNDEGTMNVGNFWNLKRKLSPKPSDPPTAMLDRNGNLLTDAKDIVDEAVKHYQDVLSDKPIDEDYKHIQTEKEELCMERLKLASKIKTPDWTMSDINVVFKYLKKDKSRDPLGYPNELFKEGIAGDDLKLAVLKLMNKIKEKQQFPTCLRLCNITNLYKHKGPKNSFNSYRGIFRVTILRCILDRLIYNDLYHIIEENLTDCNVGSRKKRNIRDNLFVLNAILTEVKQSNEEALDICLYDVIKCFDNLWLSECINDLYEAGFNNDKLPLLFQENLNAMVAIKTSSGTSSRISIRNSVMQGTVWAGLMCTATMDKFGKHVYSEQDLVYKYKNTVDVPPLQMVDDILTISKCGTTSVTINSAANSFISSKKLQYGSSKCARIHIQPGRTKQTNKCAELTVNGEKMEDSDKEKYLGDVINKNASSHATVVERVSKGYGILANIRAIMHDIPLGKRRVEIGLQLRQAWFLNSCLLNSEVWLPLNNNDKNELKKLDHSILRAILGAHPKSPIELLYLETGALPILDIMATRRMTYLKTLIDRPDSELTKKVYNAQKINPTPGDWYSTILQDFDSINEEFDEYKISLMSDKQYKSLIKGKVRTRVFNNLIEAQKNHNKINMIKYLDLSKPQPYLLSSEFDNQMCSLLFNIRSRTVNGIKGNFPTLYKDDKQCNLCGQEDTQEHILKCHMVNAHVANPSKCEYSDIFGTPRQQREITLYFDKVLKVRERLLDELKRRIPVCTNTGPTYIYN